MAERSNNYPTGHPNGMSFINNWVFTGGKGYRVEPEDRQAGTFRVVSYAATQSQAVYGGQGLTEDDAHDMAVRLAKR